MLDAAKRGSGGMPCGRGGDSMPRQGGQHAEAAAAATAALCLTVSQLAVALKSTAGAPHPLAQLEVDVKCSAILTRKWLLPPQGWARRVRKQSDQAGQAGGAVAVQCERRRRRGPGGTSAPAAVRFPGHLPRPPRCLKR